MKIRGILKAYLDKNCPYHAAFEYTDTETNQRIFGKASGGYSNIYAIRRYMFADNYWDESIMFFEEELPTRKYNNLVKLFPYAGCTPDELANYIKNKLGV